MTVTVHGVLARKNGHAIQRDDWGITNVHGIETDDLRIEPKVPVTLDHSGTEIVDVERDVQGDIHVVAVLDDADELVDMAADRDVFWSGEYLVQGKTEEQAWIGRNPVGEICTRGAFAGAEQSTRRIPVNRDHNLERLVGKVDDLDPYAARGLISTLRVARTALGDETLALAADGILDASVGFGIPQGGETWNPGRTLRRINKAFLDHIALTPTPAYETANVLAVRSTR